MSLHTELHLGRVPRALAAAAAAVAFIMAAGAVTPAPTNTGSKSPRTPTHPPNRPAPRAT